MRGLRLASRLTVLVLVCALTGPALPSAPAARAASSNIVVFIAVGADLRAPVIPRGGTATVGSLSFKAGANVETIGPDSADNISIRFDLPSGLRWGTDLPDQSENCTSSANSAECRPGFILDPQNPSMRAAGWVWDVVAEAPGTYQVKAALISSSASDPDPSDNTAVVTVIVTRTVVAGAAKITPAKPRAGRVVSARVAVQAGGAPITPIRVTCAATVGVKKLVGQARPLSGSATCTFVTPRGAHAKTLRGTVAFTAGDTRLSRRFAVKLR